MVMELEGKGLSNYDKRVLIWTSNEFSLPWYRYQTEYRKLRDTRRTPIVCSQSFILLKTSTQDPLSFGVMAVLCDGRLILPVDVGYNESM